MPYTRFGYNSWDPGCHLLEGWFRGRPYKVSIIHCGMGVSKILFAEKEDSYKF